MTNKDLEVVINAYRQNQIGDKEILLVFSKLAEWVFSHKSYKFDYPKPDKLCQEAASLCLEKLQRFSNDKGKARNFFITIIGCYLRQVCRSQMNLKKKNV